MLLKITKILEFLQRKSDDDAYAVILLPCEEFLHGRFVRNLRTHPVEDDQVAGIRFPKKKEM